MSKQDRRIICRRCNETIDRSLDNCPHCGAGVRNRRGPIVILLIGLAILIPAAFNESWMLVFIGFVLGLGGGYVLYERRQRIKAAGTDNTPGSTDETTSTEEA